MNSKTEDKKVGRPEWLPYEAWPFDIKLAEVDGAVVAYTDDGDGPTLLLVHDGMWSYVWGQMIDELSGRFRVVTLDFPGSGLSPYADRPISLEGDSMFLEEFAFALGVDCFTGVFHDLGGPVGIGFAARHPERVNGLVLINTFAWPPHLKSLRAMLRLMSSRPVRALNTTTNLIPRMTSGRFGVGRHLDATGREAFLGGFQRKESRRRFHEIMAGAVTESEYLARVESALSSTLVDKPVLTVFGKRNDPFGFQARFRDYFTDVEEMTVPGGNHFPMSDDPKGVASRIIAWYEDKVPS